MGVGKPSCCSGRQPVELESNMSRQRTPGDAEAIAESIELDLLRQELDTTRTQLHHLQAQHILATNQSIASYSRLYDKYNTRSQENSKLAAQIYVHYLCFRLYAHCQNAHSTQAVPLHDHNDNVNIHSGIESAI